MPMADDTPDSNVQPTYIHTLDGEEEEEEGEPLFP